MKSHDEYVTQILIQDGWERDEMWLWTHPATGNECYTQYEALMIIRERENALADKIAEERWLSQDEIPL